jgi:hypothetical protein
LFAAGTLIGAFRLASGSPGVTLGVLGVTAAGAGIWLAIAAAVYIRQRQRRQRYLSAVSDLARQFRGQQVGGLEAVVAWLNAYWAAPYEIVDLGTSPYHVAAALDAGGYPALVDVAPPPVPHRYRDHAHVLIAADVPAAALRGEALSPAAAQASWHWLQQAGFSVTIGPSGLLARAHGPTLIQLHWSPESIHLLSTVITTLTGYARALGAEPVAAVPSGVSA